MFTLSVFGEAIISLAHLLSRKLGFLLQDLEITRRDPGAHSKQNRLIWFFPWFVLGLAAGQK